MLYVAGSCFFAYPKLPNIFQHHPVLILTCVSLLFVQKFGKIWIRMYVYSELKGIGRPVRSVCIVYSKQCTPGVQVDQIRDLPRTLKTEMVIFFGTLDLKFDSFTHCSVIVLSMYILEVIFLYGTVYTFTQILLFHIIYSY